MYVVQWKKTKGGFGMRLAIVDDNAADRERLCALLLRWADESAVPLAPPPAEFSDGETFLSGFVPGRFDIVFLDIYMDNLDGMETARQLRAQDPRCRLVFTTTSTEFAVDSYEVDAAYYLVKPFSYGRLCQAMERCGISLLELGQAVILPGGERLPLHPIVYTEYQNRHVVVHNMDGTTREVAMSQGDFSALLLTYPYFCDCFKGILVNFEAVDKLLTDRFVLKEGSTVPISRLKYRQVREQFLRFTYICTRGDS